MWYENAYIAGMNLLLTARAPAIYIAGTPRCQAGVWYENMCVCVCIYIIAACCCDINMCTYIYVLLPPAASSPPFFFSDLPFFCPHLFAGSTTRIPSTPTHPCLLVEAYESRRQARYASTSRGIFGHAHTHISRRHGHRHPPTHTQNWELIRGSQCLFASGQEFGFW